ncbi:MAG: 16S rRNA (guanine(966)-N(2))-methyltransferase RsmD [Gammaproteobacteria bacterium]|nr:16S rRNA (guanine(966)-N(2))-methyltransferase RsmD [Gammaproteobacteria bacterium]
MARKRSQVAGESGQVRIIAGAWRGRSVTVAAADGLRPSGDRVRETVFNWLQWDLAGTCCLDLFAGSGVLAFEALSRGAARADLVELSSLATAELKRTIDKLGCADSAVVHPQSWEAFLESASGPYDLVFIDPPFAADLHSLVLDKLCHQTEPGLLSDKVKLYIEAPVVTDLAALCPKGFELTKSKKFGEVRAGLLQRSQQV